MVEPTSDQPTADPGSRECEATAIRDQETAIGPHEIVAGLAGIAMDESAPVTARVSAYSLLGKHLGLFAGSGGESHSDLAALMREIADREHDFAGGRQLERQAGDKNRDAR